MGGLRPARPHPGPDAAKDIEQDAADGQRCRWIADIAGFQDQAGKQEQNTKDLQRVGALQGISRPTESQAVSAVTGSVVAASDGLPSSAFSTLWSRS